MKFLFQKYIIIFINLTVYASTTIAMQVAKVAEQERPPVVIASRNEQDLDHQRLAKLDSVLNRKISNPNETRPSSILLRTQSLKELLQHRAKKDRPLTISHRLSISDTVESSTPSNHNFSDSIPVQDNDIHIKLTRNQFHLIECACLFLGGFFGAYKAKQIFQSAQVNPEFTIVKRGLPTDAAGVVFWSFGKLSSVASSGVALVLAGFALHKTKGWIDTIYASDTDRRIDKKIEPIISDLQKFALYVDEKTNTLLQNHLFLSNTTTSIAQEQENLTNLIQETITIIEEMAQEDQRQNPTNTKNQAMVAHATKLTHDAAQAIEGAQQLTAKLHNQSSQGPTAKNPILTKEQPSKCCGGCKQQ